jgi:LacI family transcriptional regulator
MKPRVKMSDIAKKLKISTVTVSKALTGKEGVSDKLREQIRRQAEKMNYVYNSLPHSMLKGRSSIIGILIGKKFMGESSFYWVFFMELLNILRQQKYLGVLEIVTKEDENGPVMPAFLQEGKVDGVIVLGQLSDQYLTTFTSKVSNCVFLDFYSEIGKCDCISSNNFLASYKLTKLLIDRGHRKIAYIGSTSATTSIMDRYLGFCKAMMESALPYNDAIEDRDKLGRSFSEFKLEPGNFTAYVCNNDRLAGKVIHQLDRLNLKVPGDISVVGFDNADATITADVEVTSVEMNVHAMCESAVNSVIRHIEDETYKPHGMVFIEAKLVEKKSVCTPE